MSDKPTIFGLPPLLVYWSDDAGRRRSVSVSAALEIVRASILAGEDPVELMERLPDFADKIENALKLHT